jgi:hypothetical protein
VSLLHRAIDFLQSHTPIGTSKLENSIRYPRAKQTLQNSFDPAAMQWSPKPATAFELVVVIVVCFDRLRAKREVVCP